MKNKKLLFLLVVVFCFIVSFGVNLNLVSATTAGSSTSGYSLKTGLQQSSNASGLQSARTLEQTIGMYLKIVFGLLGSLFLILIIYAGIVWMLSGGKKDGITKAKDTMINAIIGLVIMLIAYSLTSYVIQKIASVV